MDSLFDNTYTKLPQNFYSKSKPANFSAPRLISFNKELALSLGLEQIADLEGRELANIFTGQSMLEGGAYISQNYCGHQFGHFNPQLGDGRAILIGETKGPHKRDIQLKGSGPTAYSRRGDGFSELGPVLREYLVSEYMHATGVPTTRALAACTTGDTVYRETPSPGGVFTRVASSHIRIGTFEFYASRNQIDDLRVLFYYAVDRHYTELRGVKGDDQVVEFLKAVSQKQAHMISKWMQIGFIHGVMNTDNMSIVGETLDFGPCAFMDHFEKDKVYSYIDRHGRYRYNNQLEIGIWNLYQLANSLLPLMTSKSAIAEIETALTLCQSFYHDSYKQKMLEKYGLKEFDQFESLNNSFLKLLETNTLDFTNSFRLLSKSPHDLEKLEGSGEFFNLWPSHLSDGDLMAKANPTIVPRNHLIDRAIKEAYLGDYSFFNDCRDIFTGHTLLIPEEFKAPPEPSQIIKNTFCGT